MTRLLPIEEATDQVTLTITVDGAELPGTVAVQSVDILREVNRIPHARLHIADGDPSQADFATSARHFAPGALIVIEAGYHGAVTPVFTGIVLRQRIAVRNGRSWLEADCRDLASKMTLTRRHRSFEDMTDSDILADILGDYDMTPDLASTTVTHPQILQYQATDWDFAMCRLEANGQYAAIEDGTFRSFAPVLASPAATLVYGTNIREMDAEIDARHQIGAVTALAWDPVEQSLQEIEAADPGWTAPGRLSADDLVAATGRSTDQIWHGGALAGDELQAWADASLLRARVAGACGRVRVQGVSALKLGDTVALDGLGARFNGDALVTGLRHIMKGGDWTTDISFGAPPVRHADRFDVSNRAAAALAPAVAGLQIGVVTALEGDPAGEHRIRVKLPLGGMAQDGVWARQAMLDAGDGRGSTFRPEIEDEVVVGFLHDDPSYPVILGMLHSSAKPPPEEATDDNHIKGFTSRSGLKISFDDENAVLTLSTPDGASLVLSDGDGGVTLTDQNGNSLSMTSDGISLSSEGAITTSTTGDVTVEGGNIGLSASQELKAEGSASGKLSSSGILEISGSMVMIN